MNSDELKNEYEKESLGKKKFIGKQKVTNVKQK